MTGKLLALQMRGADATSTGAADVQTVVASPLFRAGFDGASMLEDEDADDIEAAQAHASSATDGSEEHEEEIGTLGTQREAMIYNNILANKAGGKVLMELLDKAVPVPFDSEKELAKKSTRRALRAMFAVLLKHSAAPYVEPVYDATSRTLSASATAVYRTALRRTVLVVDNVRERYALSRKQACDRVVERCKFLLRIAPAVMLAAQATAGIPQRPELMRGISNPSASSLPPLRSSSTPDEADTATSPSPSPALRHALQTLKDSIKLQDYDDEDEEGESEQVLVHRGVIAFVVGEVPVPVVRDALARARLCARARARALQAFAKLLASVHEPGTRSALTWWLSTAFEDPHPEAPFTKQHFLAGTEGAGPVLSAAVRTALFKALGIVIRDAASSQEPHTGMIALNACSLPFTPEDFGAVSDVGLLDFLSGLVRWQAGTEYVGEAESSMVLRHADFLLDAVRSASVSKGASVGASGAGAGGGAASAAAPVNFWSSKRSIDGISLSADKLSIVTYKKGLCVAEHPIVGTKSYFEVTLESMPRHFYMGIVSVSNPFLSPTQKPSSCVQVKRNDWSSDGSTRFGLAVDIASRELVLYRNGRRRSVGRIGMMESEPLHLCVFASDGRMQVTANFDIDKPALVPATSTSASSAASSSSSAASTTPAGRLSRAVASRFVDGSTQVYTFGQNDCGELGLSDSTMRSRPTLQPAVVARTPVYAVQVAAGKELTAVLYSNGVVYASGMNSNGNCGVGARYGAVVASPTPVAMPGGSKIVSVFLNNGAEHMLLLSNSLQLYAVGANNKVRVGVSVCCVLHAS